VEASAAGADYCYGERERWEVRDGEIGGERGEEGGLSNELK